jgi:hypothetical protein
VIYEEIQNILYSSSETGIRKVDVGFQKTDFKEEKHNFTNFFSSAEIK